MSRLRVTFLTMAALMALAALTIPSVAQPPGGGGGFGGRGRGGFGGPGGFFGGRGGGSLLQLASNPAVQEDLKLKDKQKAQIKSLNDKYDERSRELRSQMGGGRDGGGPRGPGQPGGDGGRPNRNAQNADDNAVAGDGGGAGGGFGGGQGQGQDPNAPGGGRGRGNRGNRNQDGQGVPEDPEVVAARNEQRQMAREAMTELRQGAESSLGRILDKGQVTRLKQIQLQLEGPQAVLREDVMDRLQIDEAQVEMIHEFMNENRDAARATWRSRGEMMKTAFARLNPNAAAGGQNGGVNGNGGGAGGDNANDNNGGNGGGRGRRGNFNPEAMRKVMEDPQVKAQMEEFRTQDDKLTSQLVSAINKVMTPRQRATYKKMLGAPFDRSKLGGGGPWGSRGGPGGAQAKGTPSTKAASSDDDDDAKAKSTSTAAKPKPAAAKRKSLRERRGESNPSDN